MSNFSINPNFNSVGFDNSINEFNKIFQNQNNKVNENVSFDEVFNNQKPMENAFVPIKGNVSQTIGIDSINAQKIANLSPTAQMAQNIGQSFSNSINELNEVTRQSEKDFETFASGGDISVHDVMISAQKSGLAMQMAIQLRNQMLNAYNEFKNMSV